MKKAKQGKVIKRDGRWVSSIGKGSWDGLSGEGTFEPTQVENRMRGRARRKRQIQKPQGRNELGRVQGKEGGRCIWKHHKQWSRRSAGASALGALGFGVAH